MTTFYKKNREIIANITLFLLGVLGYILSNSIYFSFRPEGSLPILGFLVAVGLFGSISGKSLVRLRRILNKRKKS